MAADIPSLLPLLLLLQLGISGTLAARSGCTDIQSVPTGFQSISYNESMDFFENPDRGFYVQLETSISSFTPLTLSELEDRRTVDGMTMVKRLYNLDGLQNSSLPQSFLDSVEADLQVIRQAGWTAFPRFAYTLQLSDPPVPPYNDASKARMLEHIRQLEPILKGNADVISAVAAGFIGVFGEWFYSDAFGVPDSSSTDPDLVLGLTNTQWNDRQEVLSAVIEANGMFVPVLIRAPFYKTTIFDSTPTTLTEVRSATKKGRTGHHNDCFLASDTDLGTYIDIEQDKSYLEADSLYLPMGGETCLRAPLRGDGSRRSDCETATAELARFHWAFINRDFNPDVISDWRSQSCFNDIRRRLGYRLYLKQAILPTTVGAGGTFCYQITLANSGFAAPFKLWIVSLVLSDGQATFSVPLPDLDVRMWLPGQDIVLSGAVGMPSSIPPGPYEVFLTLVKANMTDQADSYVLLTNTGNPSPSLGLNPLQATVQVEEEGRRWQIWRWWQRCRLRWWRARGTNHWLSGEGSSDSSCPRFRPSSLPPASIYPRVQSTECTPVRVNNPSFEVDNTAWAPFTNGYAFSSDNPQQGAQSIEVSNGGASQGFTFNPPVQKLILTAWSRHTGTSAAATSDYSLYCDIARADGTYLFGQIQPFTLGNAEWHNVQLNIDVPEGISVASCNLLYRDLSALGGAAFFDNVKAWTLPASASFSVCSTYM